MKIYYLLIEGKPNIYNEESKEVAGAFINCWVTANDETTAKEKAIRYINTLKWEIVNIEEIYIVTRERYADEPDSLECFDESVNFGVGAVFYTWPINDEDEFNLMLH